MRSNSIQNPAWNVVTEMSDLYGIVVTTLGKKTKPLTHGKCEEVKPLYSLPGIEIRS